MTVTIWRRSCAAWSAGRDRQAKAWKALNFLLFHAVLPYEATLGADVVLYHHGLGVVVHPLTTLKDRVTLAHGVTIGVSGDNGSVVVDHDVHVGAHAIMLATGGRVLHIGAHSTIGAGALVIRDVPPYSQVLAPPGVVRPWR